MLAGDGCADNKIKDTKNCTIKPEMKFEEYKKLKCVKKQTDLEMKWII